MPDPYAGTGSKLDSPALHAFAVVPNDTTDLTTHARGIYIGSAGNVALITSGGDSVTFTSLAAGTILPVRVGRVKVTGTTASNLIGLR